MNNRFLTIASLLASSTLFMAGCSDDNSSFETPRATTDTPTNTGTVSQKNFTVAPTDIFPAVVDLTAGTFSEQSVDIVVKIGDLKNQLLTDEHTVFFKTQWGLIEPSCVTENGKCSVTWETSEFGNIPATLTNVVTAWTVGEESFPDTNGNGKFDDAETDTNFDDLREPFLDINQDGVFDGAGGDELIDVVNGLDPTGANGISDTKDFLLNSPNCIHTTLCGRATTYVWSDTRLILTGPPAAAP